MSPRSYQSLLGVLFGFLCIFPLLMKREKKAPLNTSEVLLQTAAQRDVIVQIGKTVEALDAAVEEASHAGNESLRQRLAANRDALRQSALNASLWKE